MNIILPRSAADEICRIVSVVLNETVSYFGDMPGWENHRGGSFCLADDEAKMIYLVSIVGPIVVEKASKYVAFSQEKPMRLSTHHDHLSSWQSCRPELNEWGGAIRDGRFLWGFSGLPQLGDEVVMLGSAYMAGGIKWVALHHLPGTGNIGHYDRIAAISENPYWAKIREFVMAPHYIKNP